MAMLSEEQRIQLLQFIPRVPAALSVIGSSLILLAVWTRRDRNEPFHRMMFCLSLYDLLGAIWFVLGSIPVPEEYGIPGSIGSTSICSAQAMIIYFLMKVRYNVQDSTITKWFEPAVHISALALGLAFALTGVSLKVFNPIGFGGPSNSPLCYIQAFPPGCDFVPGMECERGGNASSVIWFIAIVPFGLATLALLTSLVLVMHSIVATERRNRRYTFTGTSRNTRVSVSANSTMVTTVGKRCLVYGVVFLNTFLWTSISMIIHNKEPPKWNSFWLGCLAFIFMPLQGLLNFFIYISPRFKRLRKENTNKSMFWVIFRSVYAREEGTVTAASA